MAASVITPAEFVEDNVKTAERWRQWLAAHPQATSQPCDIFGSKTVSDLLRHIALVELRHSQRLTGQKVTSPDEVTAQSTDEIFGIHDQAITNLRNFIASATDDTLREEFEIQTLSAGAVRVSRRKLFVHIMLHTKRHFAQLATLLRECGLKTDWPQDFLFSEAMN